MFAFHSVSNIIPTQLNAKIRGLEGYFITKFDLAHAYSDNNIVAVPEQLKSAAFLIKAVTGESMSGINSTHFICKLSYAQK